MSFAETRRSLGRPHPHDSSSHVRDMWHIVGSAVLADARQASLLPGLLPTDTHTSLDRHWAARAIELAQRADHRTSPNPMVGAVVLDKLGQLAAEGFHRQAGQAHAEAEALAAAGELAAGGTLYVNLEPCSFQGRTPPCADAIIAAGIKRVVVSTEDPDERVRGRGIERLRAAGIEVEVGLHAERAMKLNEFYFKHRTSGLPFVSVKYAMSVDGKIATRTYESRWISGEEARLHSHRMRHAHDAILVGVETVLNDNPELTTRIDDSRQPLRVILDSKLRTPPDAKATGANALIATVQERDLEGTETLHLKADRTGRVPLMPLLHVLAKRGILSVLVEGGGETHASFFEAGLVDKVYAYVAPKVIGGGDAPGPVGGTGIEHIEDVVRLKHMDMIRVGEDILITGYVDVQRDS